MFIVLLKFSNNKNQRAKFMDGHHAWLQQGFDDGVFLAAGSLEPGLGGGILAHHGARTALQDRVEADPFVRNDVVTAEIIEIAASKTDPRLEFLRA